jgi:3',5'-cyclic AMP phosphodiesterase CpdA
MHALPDWRQQQSGHMSERDLPPERAAISQTVRLLHVSDIHFGAEDADALEAFSGFLDRVKPDAVLVAGDITQSGRRREFAAARDWLAGLGVQIIAAPGNHDTPALHLPLRFAERMMTPFERYSRYFGEFDAVGGLVELCGGMVRISAINTARGVQGRLNWADGVIKLEDLEAALALLSQGPSNAWRILLCHHPLREPGHSRISVDTRRGGEALRRCAAAHVDAIVTGHVHDAFAHPIHSPRGQMVQMGSGTLSTRLRATQPSFCLMTIDRQHLVQEIVSVGRSGLTVRCNYDSRVHEAGAFLHEGSASG